MSHDVDREWSMGGTPEAALTPELAAKRRDMRVCVATAPFRDNPVYAVDNADLSRIDCPLLSVANWARSVWLRSGLNC